MVQLLALLLCNTRLSRSLEFEARVQVGDLFFVCLFVCLRSPFPMHHTSKCLPDTGQSFASLSEVELSSSRAEGWRLSGCPVSSLDFLPATLAHSLAAWAPHLSQ